MRACKKSRGGARLLAALLLLCPFSALPLSAAEDDAPNEARFNSNEAHFNFALPPFESRISLGVFDSKDRLIRRLAEAKPERDFAIGLNGLIGTWDGCDDSGNPVPPGNYRIRGYAVGNWPVEGIAYWDNDWVAESGAAFPLMEVLDLCPLPEGVLLLFRQEDGRAAIARYHTDGGIQWQQILEDAPSPEEWRLARGHGDSVVLWHGREGVAFRASTGELLSRGELPHVPVAALVEKSGDLLCLDDDFLQRVNLLGWRDISREKLPFSGRLIVADADGSLLALDTDGRLWINQEGKWNLSEPWSDRHFRSIAAASDGNFWGLINSEESPSAVRAGLFSRDGEFLKETSSATFSSPPVQIETSPTSNEIYFLLREPSTSHRRASEVLGIRPSNIPPAEAPPPQSDNSPSPSWEIFLQKAIRESESLPPDFTSLPLRLQLETTNYLRGGRETGSFRLVVRRPDTLELQSPEGLVLADLVRTAPVLRAGALWSPEQPGALRLIVQSRAWSEEFLLTGLEELLSLDVAEITWPPEN